jgi:hypothetical protein
MTVSGSGNPIHPELEAGLRAFGVERSEGGSVLSDTLPALIRGWRVALDRASQRMDVLPLETRTWLQQALESLASQPASDEMRARAAEVEAALRLSWVGQVTRIPENTRASVDFQVEDLNVEVYCPQQHGEERRVVEADLAQQLQRAEGPVRVAVSISHPTTGSGRSVDSAGRISRDPKNLALTYPANKLIDRLLHAKRDGRQLMDSERNVLWLDLKHGLCLWAIDCVPLRSEVAKGTCFAGTHGVWHAFYAKCGSPHFPERTTLEWPIAGKTYQQQKDGWFREMPKVSAALLAVLDGTLLFENPWADIPLDARTRRRFARLSEFRPETSWFGCSDALRRDVDSTLEKISWLAQIVSPPTEQVPT